MWSLAFILKFQDFQQFWLLVESNLRTELFDSALNLISLVQIKNSREKLGKF